jgi:hypothetical protein
MVPNFLYSLINHHVTIYQAPNTGVAYNLCYMLGAMLFFGGGVVATRY